ncbi:hypothetical protein ACIGV8_20000 [Streptomyces albidoflavus]
MGLGEGEYALERWRDRSGPRWNRKHGYRGSLGEFGAVEVVCPAQRHGDTYVTEIRGKSVPLVAFSGWAWGAKPSLHLGRLTVAGEGIRLRRNRWALTRQGRALRFQVAGRAYRYYATSPRHRHRALAREGVEIEVRRPRGGVGKLATVRVRGAADATDVALAVVMCGVNTRNLTRGGAVRAFFGRASNLLDIFH